MIDINLQSIRTKYGEIDHRFATGQMSAVVEYINSLTMPLVLDTGTDAYVPEPTEREQNELYNKTDTYLDDGTGRVSKGLRGLELLSKLCKGVNPQDLFLFSNVIYASSPHAVKTANRDGLINIVIANLGMTFVVQGAEAISPSEVMSFKNLCFVIGSDVKSGVLNPEKYKKRVLRYAKKLTLISTLSTQRTT